MTIAITSVFTGTDTVIRDVAASADGDTTASIPHGLGAAPGEVSILPLTEAGTLSAWRATTIDATNVTLTKGTTSGSGAAPAQLRVTIKRPNTLGR